jgi:cysteine desulfurase
MHNLSSVKLGKIVYLDYNATTPCSREVLDAMLPFFREDFANASSLHAMGRKAARAVNDARGHVAAAIGSSTAEEIYFTGGATEANNMVLLGLVDGSNVRRRIVVSAIEHKSVLEPCRRLSERGFEVVQIPVTGNGIVDLQAVACLIDAKTLLVSVHGANNEIGTLQPIKAISEIAHAHGALVHCDASQMLGKVPVSVDELKVDFASFSGHKLYGPKGIGILFVRRGSARLAIGPILLGGGQEADFRPGTLNVPAIVGLAEACRQATSTLTSETSQIRRLRDLFEQSILDRNTDVIVAASAAERLPGTSSICFLGVPADALIAHARCICIGTGSACTAGAVSPSHVQLACGHSREIARCFVRISLGRYTTEEEVEFAINALTESVTAIRGYQPKEANLAMLNHGE